MPTFSNKENEHITFEKDGKQREAWLSRSVAVVPCVVVQLEGQLLVLMNKRGPGAADNHGRWVLPCGYLDWDETGAEACCREVWEECQIDIQGLRKLADHPLYDGLIFDKPWHVVSNPHRDARQNVSLHYGIQLEFSPERFAIAGKVPDPVILKAIGDKREVDEVAWINVNDLPKLDIAFNHDARIEQFIQFIS